MTPVEIPNLAPDRPHAAHLAVGYHYAALWGRHDRRGCRPWDARGRAWSSRACPAGARAALTVLLAISSCWCRCYWSAMPAPSTAFPNAVLGAPAPSFSPTVRARRRRGWRRWRDALVACGWFGHPDLYRRRGAADPASASSSRNGSEGCPPALVSIIGLGSWARLRRVSGALQLVSSCARGLTTSAGLETGTAPGQDPGLRRVWVCGAGRMRPGGLGPNLRRADPPSSPGGAKGGGQVSGMGVLAGA